MGSKKPSAVSGLAALVILCVASLALFTIYVREGDSGPLHTIQLGASEVLRPVRGLLNLATSPFSAASERIEGAVDTSEKKKELEEKALEYEEGAAEAARLRQENERLRSLLQGEQPTFEYGPLARVIQPVGGQLTDRVVINVGTNDGVGPEQPVVVGNNALVGRTTSRVTPNTAEVLLITDQSFAAGVRIVPPEGLEDASGETTSAGGGPSEEESLGEGLLMSSWAGYLGVDYVDLDAGGVQGDFVITSGRAGNSELIFPPGLLVGTVESAISQDIEQYMKIVVAPTVQADDLQEVRVIVGW